MLEDQGPVVTAVFLYIDDLVLIAYVGLFGLIRDQMKMRFWMHDLGSVSIYLGMHLERNREHPMIAINQHSYIWTILAKFRKNESRPAATPMAMKLQQRTPDEAVCDPTIF
jgi:hypothetical protein